MTLKVLAATRKGLFTLERTGPKAAPWKIAHVDFLADNVSIVLHDKRTGHVHAALDHGHFGVKMHRAEAPGAPWQEMPAPAYPPKPDDCQDKDMWGNVLPWSLVRVWALETGGASEPGVIWCGTIPGALFRSPDNGASWDIVDTLWRLPARAEWMGGGADLPGINAICVDPRDAKTLRISVSTGGVWMTQDGGATWTNDNTGMWQDHAPEEHKFNPNGQDAHRLVQSPSSPDRLWVQHHNGIFRSDDGGKVWHECLDVKPSSFGFAVAVHPTDGDTAWFVPGIKDEQRIPVDGRFVVTRTRDGGRSFETLNKGLPSEPAYDLVYRHGLDVSGSGNDLVVGSTTGGLWVSNDQGDTWSAAAARLPPVYAVRWLEE